MLSNSVETQAVIQARKAVAMAIKAGLSVCPCRPGKLNGRKGLYAYHPTKGPGILYDHRLSPAWIAWVVAHELGHHFNILQLGLFSPFAGYGQQPKKEEAAANRWAAKHLIEPELWTQAEDRSPLNLSAIVSELGLPLEAGIHWERLARRTPEYRERHIRVPLAPEDFESLNGNWSSTGGWQDPIVRVISNGLNARISRKDFSLIRERVARPKDKCGGGYRTHYQLIIKKVQETLSLREETFSDAWN